VKRQEDSLQITVADELRAAGLFFLHVKNQGKWSPQYGKRLNRMGRRKGALDLEVFAEISDKLPRGILWIECKRPPQILPSGKVSKAKPRVDEDQEAFIADCTSRGMPVLIVRTLDELRAGMKALGVPLRGRAM